MRRSRKNSNWVIYLIIIVIVVGIVVSRIVMNGGSTNKYKKYVSSFEKAINEYCENDLYEDSVKISFEDLKNLLISKGYLDEYENSSVLLSADDINIEKNGNDVSFYNL